MIFNLILFIVPILLIWGIVIFFPMVKKNNKLCFFKIIIGIVILLILIATKYVWSFMHIIDSEIEDKYLKSILFANVLDITLLIMIISWIFNLKIISCYISIFAWCYGILLLINVLYFNNASWKTIFWDYENKMFYLSLVFLLTISTFNILNTRINFFQIFFANIIFGAIILAYEYIIADVMSFAINDNFIINSAYVKDGYFYYIQLIVLSFLPYHSWLLSFVLTLGYLLSLIIIIVSSTAFLQTHKKYKLYDSSLFLEVNLLERKTLFKK